jgi:hypothetical protein
MSELEQEAPRRWRRFSEEFKREAVRLVVDQISRLTPRLHLMPAGERPRQAPEED